MSGNSAQNGKTLRLRPWQRRALDAYEESKSSDFLAVATPGAGKTTFALTAARLTLPELTGRLVIVAPTKHLKEQWAEAAERFGLHLDPDWSPNAGIPTDVHGVITTYQQIGSSPEACAPVAAGGFVILDEVHHAGEERSWGDGIRTAFDGAARRLALSGTPFRSDTRSIPFVRYTADQVVPDIEYGYGDALADGRVVRPVYFPRFGGHMEWMAPDGAVLAATFDDALARTQANQRLRAALSLDGEWLPTVLSHANQQLVRIRERHPDAGGLVIASDQEHAWGIARLLRDRFRANPTVAVSEDPDASAKITKFSQGNAPWIVAVRMVSEGVDIPRLRVGVFATTTTTELFFRQAVGRIVRHTPGGGLQRAYLFVPDDVRLKHWADSIAEVRRHRLERRSPAETDELVDQDDDRDEGEADQLSLFAVLSATATDLAAEDDIFVEDEQPESETAAEPEAEEEQLVIDLTALPPPISGLSFRASSRREREQMRDLNAELARQLVDRTGRTHAAVNFELNRLVGIGKVSEASVDQLQRRAKAAEDWLARDSKRRNMARFV